MAIDLGALVTNINAGSNLVLVTPNKNIGITPIAKVNANSTTTGATPPPPVGFLFDFAGEETASLTSDITDHYVEDNTTIQDQVSLKPEQITVHGYVSELNNVPPPALAAAKFAADKLTQLSPFVPVLSSSAIIAYNAAAQAYSAAVNAANAAISTFSTLTGIGADRVQTKQQAAFDKFYGWWKSRQLFKVQTPWAVFDNMAILSLKSTQSEDTNTISEFEITFKKINLAKSLVSVPIESGRRASQNSALVDKGVSKGVPGPSLSANIASTGIAQ